MDLKTLETRVTQLLSMCDTPPSLAVQSAIHAGTLSVMNSLYGRNSAHEVALEAMLLRLRRSSHPGNGSTVQHSTATLKGILLNIQGELQAGLVGSLQARVTGDVLSDLIKLARAVLEEPGDGAKNVAATLAAASFEDTIRRLASVAGIAHCEKLADAITALKDKQYLQGAQIGVAQSYLNFRNSALHAQWDRVERPAVHSVLAFTEQLLLQHFT